MSWSNPFNNAFCTKPSNENEDNELPFSSRIPGTVSLPLPFPDAESAGEASSDDVLSLWSMSKKKNKKNEQSGGYKHNGMGFNEGLTKNQEKSELVPSWYKENNKAPAAAPTVNKPKRDDSETWKPTPWYLNNTNQLFMAQNPIPRGKCHFEAYEEATAWLTAHHPFANSDTQIVGSSINARDDKLAIKIINEYFRRENLGRGHRNPYWELSGAGTTYWDEKPVQYTRAHTQTAAWEWQV
ncbi:hypothetical protein B0J14DRAFT_311294 [Halenospora varia]|nr:hypothetical protein B0J14DRAFT_311294 [Halenospora varia]